MIRSPSKLDGDLMMNTHANLPRRSYDPGAALYSIMGTAKLNGIDPKAYLTAVLKRINNTPINQVDQLLPWNIEMDSTDIVEAV